MWFLVLKLNCGFKLGELVSTKVHACGGVQVPPDCGSQVHPRMFWYIGTHTGEFIADEDLIPL